MGTRDIETALSATLDVVESGEATVEEALSRYPSLRADLEPLVTLAMEIRAMPRVMAPDSLRAHKRPIFTTRPMEERTTGWWQRLPLPLAPFHGWTSTAVRAAAAIAVVITMGTGTLVVSAGSLPEEPLYPVKLAMESVRLAFTPDSGDRAELGMQFAARRLEEVSTAVEQERPAVIEQGLALYQERVENALAEPAVEQASGEVDQRLQEALKSNHEVLQRMLSEPEKIENPRARAAIDAAAERTVERAEKLRKSESSKQEPGAGGEKASEKPEKSNPSSDAPGQQAPPVPPADSGVGAAGRQPPGLEKEKRTD